MSLQTIIIFLNSKDHGFLQAKEGTPLQREQWEDENGPISDRPGAPVGVDLSRATMETEDEYGGHIISLKDLPPEVTHICIFRC